MKKFFRILLIILLVIIVALIVTPLLFKDQLLQKAKEVANTSVNAKVDFTDFGLTLFRNFPQLTVSLKGVSVVNLEPFEGDTLVAFDEFSAAVNLMSVIKGDQIKVRSILLDHPRISAKVLEDGSANWDIAKEGEEKAEKEVDTTASGSMDMNVALKRFEIRDAGLFYNDRKSGMKASLEHFNFVLSGDLSADQTNITIESDVQSINFFMEGIRYLKDAMLKMVIDVDADLANSVFTLTENSIALNELELVFDGKVAMPDEEKIEVE